MDTINDKNHQIIPTTEPQIIPTTEPQKPAKKGIQLGIKRIRALLTALGKPHETFKAIHLSGTNGKGSTTLMIGAVLDAAGIKTATFTSPHLIKEQDSIKIGGGANQKIISDDIYNAARSRVEEVNQTVDASAFEVLTATAFLAFSMERIDVAVVEVGLGGLLDATNVLPPPLVCVICRIAIDHAEFLGNTIEEIVNHKLGIIKAGIGACVMAIQPYQEVMEIGQNVCQEKGVDLYTCTSDAATDTSTSDAHIVQVEYPKGCQMLIRPCLIGAYQLENMTTVCTVLDVLVSKLGFNIPCKAVEKGLSEAKNPGRLEIVDTQKYGEILLDGAHNEDGVTALQQHLVKERAKRRNDSICFIMGLSGHKNPKRFISLLGCKQGDVVVPVSFSQPEGMPWIHSMDPSLIGKATEYYLDCGGSLEMALESVDRSKTPLVVVCGSLYLVAEFYRLLSLS